MIKCPDTSKDGAMKLEYAQIFSTRKLVKDNVKLYQIISEDDRIMDVYSNTTKEEIESWANGQSAWHNGWFYNQVDENETMELAGMKGKPIREDVGMELIKKND